MQIVPKPDWLVPAGLVVLGIVPLAAGAVRLIGLATGAAVTPENARFVTAPVIVIVHVFAGAIYAFWERSDRHRPAGPCWGRGSLHDRRE